MGVTSSGAGHRRAVTGAVVAPPRRAWIAMAGRSARRPPRSRAAIACAAHPRSACSIGTSAACPAARSSRTSRRPRIPGGASMRTSSASCNRTARPAPCRARGRAEQYRPSGARECASRIGGRMRPGPGGTPGPAEGGATHTRKGGHGRPQVGSPATIESTARVPEELEPDVPRNRGSAGQGVRPSRPGRRCSGVL